MKFDEIWGILEKSFSACCYRNYEGQKDLLSDERYRLLTREEDGKIYAFAAYWDLGDFLFLEHLAVDPEKRRGGTGSGLMQELIGMGRQVLLEAELPETETDRKRIAFYERLGFTLYQEEHWQYPLRRESEKLRLLLMTCPAVSHDELCRLQRILYREVYHITL